MDRTGSTAGSSAVSRTRTYSLIAREHTTNDVVGVINFSEIVMGALRGAYSATGATRAPAAAA